MTLTSIPHLFSSPCSCNFGASPFEIAKSIKNMLPSVIMSVIRSEGDALCTLAVMSDQPDVALRDVKCHISGGNLSHCYRVSCDFKRMNLN